jgi:hypothetical protein
MTAKEFKRIYDVRRIVLLNGGRPLPFPDFLVQAESHGIYDKHYRYFGNGCDRQIRQQPIQYP